MSSLLDSRTQRSEQPVTELLTSVSGEADEEPGDSIFEEESRAPKRRRIRLFWYTFGLTSTLLTVGLLAGYWLLSTLDEEPRVRENTRQIVAIVELAQTALLHSKPEQHTQLFVPLTPQPGVHLVLRSISDHVEPFPDSDEARFLVAALRKQLGPDVGVARSVNGQSSLWVGFTVGRSDWWLWLDNAHLEQGISSNVWLLWLMIIVPMWLTGIVLFTRFVNRPLDALADAAMRVRAGDYTSTRLDETVPQAEVYAVNAHFNRMADQLARVEQDRAQMLAGISHDVRTPLARLRLEIEMGVSDPQARERMASDIGQVGTILNKFLDYARSRRVQLCAVDLHHLARRCVRPFAKREDMAVQIDIPRRIHVMADEVELGRVIINLLENASSYGQTPGTGFTKVRMAATIKDGWVKLRVRDFGAGVPEEQVALLTRPFFRGDAARRNVGGTGLGLTLAGRMVEAMGGQFRIHNATSGGLQALIRLPLASVAEQA